MFLPGGGGGEGADMMCFAAKHLKFDSRYYDKSKLSCKILL